MPDAGPAASRSSSRQRGIEVVGIDRDPSMLAAAARLAPELAWVEADVATVELGRTFDVVVMAGNVPLFTPEGRRAALVAGSARHVAPGGRLVAGFQLDGRYPLATYDADCARVGLVLEDRWSTWSREPLGPDAAYAVSLHRATG